MLILRLGGGGLHPILAWLWFLTWSALIVWTYIAWSDLSFGYKVLVTSIEAATVPDVRLRLSQEENRNA